MPHGHSSFCILHSSFYILNFTSYENNLHRLRRRYRFLSVLRQEGYRIIIFTTRKVTAALKKYLKDNDITYDYINRNPDQPKDAGTDKPVADIYLDDRAVCFRGNWKYALNDIAYFRPWQAERKDEKAEMEKVFEDYRKYSRQHNEAAGSL